MQIVGIIFGVFIKSVVSRNKHCLEETENNK